MRRRNIVIAVLFAMTASAAASAQSYTPFDTGAYKGPGDGSANRLMVLGSPHLSDLPSTFDPAQVEPLIDDLQSWAPQAIAIESISGAGCDVMRQYPDRYGDSVRAYCWNPALAAAATGLDVPAATAAWQAALASWPPAPTAAERRHLAALFLAGGESASALVQWLRLTDTDRHEGDGLDAALVARLEKLRARKDESLLIAAALAARLGLERVYAIDDHTADAPVSDEAAYGKAIEQAWDNPATTQRFKEADALQARLGEPGGLLALYRAYNGPDYAPLAYRSDFGAALKEPSPQRFGRGYLGYWETRNLRMAANLRDVFAARPGIRVLLIVGASHKGYIEHYLDQMHDMVIVDPLTVLQETPR